jgi:hypothetical protein
MFVSVCVCLSFSVCVRARVYVCECVKVVSQEPGERDRGRQEIGTLGCMLALAFVKPPLSISPSHTLCHSTLAIPLSVPLSLQNLDLSLPVSLSHSAAASHSRKNIFWKPATCKRPTPYPLSDLGFRFERVGFRV